MLLFLRAHPADAGEFATADAELERVAGIASDMVRRSDRLRHALVNSGLAGTPLQTTCTLGLARWMLDRWGDRVELLSVEAPLEEFAELLRLLLPQAEVETVDRPAADVQELLDHSFGSSRALQLKRLVHGLEALRMDRRVRELLWSRMRVFLKVEGADECGLTFARAPIAAPFHLTDGLQRGVDLPQVVNGPVDPPVRLSMDQQLELIATARTVLGVLERETDPVTWAGAVELFDLGRGLRIALFHLEVAHRLPFDSYVGFMAFRNGVPLAYGGAWIFPGRSKVGINVFPAMRGGESAWFFAQLLRLYRQRFGSTCFEAENYQLGHGNADGLRSGAYWFYYRLGFRPADPAVRRRADRAFKRLSDGKGRTPPLQELKALVAEGLELVMETPQGPVLDTAALSAVLPDHVVARHGGDRVRALRRALERLCACLPLGDPIGWPPDLRTALYLWALPLDLVDDLERWSAAERRALVALLKAKGEATETRHQLLLQRHARLRTAWARVAG